jgi:hypothetical protein
MAGWDDLARLRAVAAACGRRVAAALLSRSNGLPPSHDSVAAACAAACAQHFAAAGHPEMATLRHPLGALFAQVCVAACVDAVCEALDLEDLEARP